MPCVPARAALPSGGEETDAAGDVLQTVEPRGGKLAVEMEACQDGGLVRGGFAGSGTGIDAANETGEAFDERGVGVPSELEYPIFQ